MKINYLVEVFSGSDVTIYQTKSASARAAYAAVKKTWVAGQGDRIIITPCGKAGEIDCGCVLDARRMGKALRWMLVKG